MDGASRERLLRAVEHALAGDWQAAHSIAQDYEGERLANWMHAVVHRMEGDEANASYWYRRCGRADSERLSTEDELRLIRQDLAAAE